MPKEEIGKKQDQTEQTGRWFQNRGLFSDHFLQARLPEWKEWKVDAELVPFRKNLLSLYNSKKPILADLNEAQTEIEFVQPVLDLLGYINSYIVQAPTKLGRKTSRPDYALFPDEATKDKAYTKIKKNDYIQCIGIADAKYWERELDLAKSSNRDTFTNQNPSFQVAGYLTGTKQNWGILTNGRLWRLYSTKSHLPLGNYYQVDIVKLLEEAPTETLKYFYVLFRKQAMLQIEGKSLLDRILEGSEEYAVELEADIKERAYDVVELLCRGFTASFTQEQLTDATLKSIYDNSLTLLYRLLFGFYAEARELLPLTSNVSYRENYSLRRLTHNIDEILKKGHELSTTSTQYYHNINNLFQLINNGDSKLGVPEYNGGLFDPVEHPFLEKQAIPDAYLVKAIQQLARITDKKLGREVVVDYNTLRERHLGSIYEGLLEFKPMIAPHDLVVIKDKGSVKYAPANKYHDKKTAYRKGELYLATDKGERKASGSYYTPEYIVNYIAENTLDPLAKEAHEKVKALKPEVDKAIKKWSKLKEQKQGSEPTEKYERQIAEESEKLLRPYLSLKVLDPAMGSGHFLARATDFLAEAIATDPDIKSPLELTEESELTYYRRRVVESCIYGVDLNPLAVELAKLTLWLTTMAKSKPLSFLNHHLRVGNSLIGARVADLDEIPKAKGKKKAIDLSRAPVQLGLFQQAFNQKLYDLLQNRALIARLPTETLEDVHNKQKYEKDFEHNMERFRILSDVWVSTFFGNKVAWDQYNALVENLLSPEPQWVKHLQKESIQKAITMREGRHFFHWELEFPEVFYDEKSNHKENAGFDAVVGNPPWGGALDRTILGFLDATYKGVNDYESYQYFSQISVRNLAIGGKHGFIVPNTYVLNVLANPLRKWMFDYGTFDLLVDCSDVQLFDDPSVRCVLYVYEKGNDNSTIPIYKLATSLDNRATVNNWCLAKRSEIADGRPWASMLRDAKNISDLVSRMEKGSIILGSISNSKQGYIPYRLTTLSKRFGEKDAVKIKNTRAWHSTSKLDKTYLPELQGGDVFRFETGWSGVWVKYGEWVSSYVELEYFSAPRLIFREITDEPPHRLLATYVTDTFVHNPSVLNACFLRTQYSHLYCLALINSSLLSEYFYRTSPKSDKGLFPKVLVEDIRKLPIRRIAFSTPAARRESLAQDARALVAAGNESTLLGFIASRLSAQPEESDVVHDLLASLAERMIDLNKRKQTEQKRFIGWLEKEVLKGSIVDQKNKTKIRNFHEGTLEELMDVLKKNKVIPDPCPSSMWDTISGEFSIAMNTLGPLKTRIAMTDKLIDQIVYKLYGLCDNEIAIVEGKQDE